MAQRKSLTTLKTRPLEAASPPVTSPPKAQPKNGVAPRQPSRVGKVPVQGYFAPEVRKQLKAIAVDQDKTAQQLVGEALNLLFAQYGRPEIASTERE